LKGIDSLFSDNQVQLLIGFRDRPDPVDHHFLKNAGQTGNNRGLGILGQRRQSFHQGFYISINFAIITFFVIQKTQGRKRGCFPLGCPFNPAIPQSPISNSIKNNHFTVKGVVSSKTGIAIA
jgi:hypothetical protein